MPISLARPSPQNAARDWALLCSVHAQALRLSADGASVLQAERAVIEYGAATGLERAAEAWRTGDYGLARVWMNAAAAQLANALIEVPWADEDPAARPPGRTH